MSRFRGLTCLGLLAGLLITSSAGAEVEVSAFGGAHTFSPHNALGRRAGSGPQTALVNGIVGGARISYLPLPRLGAELELGVTPTTTKDDVSGMNVTHIRLQGVLNLLTGKLRPVASLGAATFIVSPSDPLRSDRDFRVAAMGGIGLKWSLADWWGVRGDARIFAVPGFENQAVAFDREVTFGVFGRFPAPPPPEQLGRPVIEDGDHDGLSDRLDKCPSDAGPIRNSGCPVDENQDRDEDGVLDRDDKCPEVAGTRELNGCKDTDSDGIIDASDKCPLEAGPKDTRGCPDKDRDGDAIVDRFDKCPTKPETKNGFEDEDGCPDELPKVAAPLPPPLATKAPFGNLAVLDFERGKTTLTAGSLPIIEAAAVKLKDYPEVLVEVVGHTDATGIAAENVKLSKARAEAVRQLLIKGGVEASRITSTGMGSQEPLTPGNTEEERKLNRRVEFRLTTRALP